MGDGVCGDHFDADVLVIGAGLAGVTAAWQLAMAVPRVRVRILEARERIGGRLLNGDVSNDLGAAWTWPSHDRHLAAAALAAGVRNVPQWREGGALLDERGAPPQPCAGAFSEERRFVGGSCAIVSGLLARAKEVASKAAGSVELELGCAVEAVRWHDAAGAPPRGAADERGWIEVRTRAASSTGPAPCPRALRARAVILAAPVALVERRVAFEPPLPTALATAMRGTPTWMADTAKVLLTFPTRAPFWRANGLSGTAFSRGGPLAQIWDNCDAEAGGREAAGAEAPTTATLAGFAFGDDARALARGGADAARVVARARAQVRAIFGAPPGGEGDGGDDGCRVEWTSWAAEEWTATAQTAHLPIGAAILRQVVPPYGRQLVLAGTETEAESGHMEGAVRSGERAARVVAALLRGEPA